MVAHTFFIKNGHLTSLSRLCCIILSFFVVIRCTTSFSPIPNLPPSSRYVTLSTRVVSRIKQNNNPNLFSNTRRPTASANILTNYRLQQQQHQEQEAPQTITSTITTAHHHRKTNKKESKNNSDQNKNITNQKTTLFFSRRRSLLALSTTIASYSSSNILHPPSSHALTPTQASSSYDTYAPSYDTLDGGSAASALGINNARSNLLALAKGNVLEIGAGTGLNLAYYHFSTSGGSSDDDGGVQSLILSDISDGMLQQARQKSNSLGLTTTPSTKNDRVSFVTVDATSGLVERFGNGVAAAKFDTVVDTFSLCVMGTEGAVNCLRQMGGVVKSRKEGGRILLLENSRSTNPVFGWYQDLTADTAARAGGKGCVYNQDVGKLIEKAGLRIETQEEFAGGFFRSFVCYKE